MTYSASPQATIEIKTSFFPLAFLLLLFKPKASINGGQPFPLTWGVTPVPVPPGRHRVDVWLPYLFFTTMGKNGTEVDVSAGGAVQVAWRAPWLVFLPGKVSVNQAQGLAAGAPGGGYDPALGGGHDPASSAGGYGGGGYDAGAGGAGGWAPQAAPQAQGGYDPQAGGPFGAAPAGAPQPSPNPSPAAAPGGWHPDPSGRHQQRYFDGTRWTEHVVDNGAQSTDPLGG